MVKYDFICEKCGNIQKGKFNQRTTELVCNVCGNAMGWGNSFPPLNALDFIHSSTDLFEQSKNCDKNNLELQYQCIIKCGCWNGDKTELDKYNNAYERILEKYADNDDTFWLEIMDTFEEEICKDMAPEQAMAVLSAIKVFSKNYFRKPYIIIVASLIEQLFNDYFKALVSNELCEYGSKVFLHKYEITGIQSAVDIIESFLDGCLRDKMNMYSAGFYEKWAGLRGLRNGIIHSNNKYVSKIKVSQIKKLADESLIVFSHLKSNLYKI